MQTPYQFGFSKGCSPIYAALLLTEVIAEACDNKKELIITLMDTSKAFDVVTILECWTPCTLKESQGHYGTFSTVCTPILIRV